jgi:CO/xanthine dehydrogenase Mo-binding subunit
MNINVSASRRSFLKGSAAAGLVIAMRLPVSNAAAADAQSEFIPNAFLRIAPGSTVTVISKHIEFGQGPYTGIATVLADEIDADWGQIKVESAPADAAKYFNSAFGKVQGTGGSTAMANSWDRSRGPRAPHRGGCHDLERRSWQHYHRKGHRQRCGRPYCPLWRARWAGAADRAVPGVQAQGARRVAPHRRRVPINPDVIRAQLEGGMGFGRSAALFSSIDLEDGRVVQSNFHDYRVLRINEMPDVEVHIVPSRANPTGIGEPGTPPIAPAIANAWSKLTGQHVFTLPFSRSAAKA